MTNQAIVVRRDRVQPLPDSSDSEQRAPHASGRTNLDGTDSSEPEPLGPRASGLTNRGGGATRETRLLAIRDLSERQARVVRRDQLRARGWTRHQVAHEINYGRWHELSTEVIALQNAPLTYAQQLWLGVLHAGAGAALSHCTTLKCNGLERWEPELFDVLCPKSQAPDPLEGFFFHESRRDYTPWVHPIRSPSQLRVEHACLLAAERKPSVRAGIGIVAACVQQGLARSDRLFDASLTISKLRHGRQIRLSLLDIAGGAHSFAEIDLGRLCRVFGLQPPTRQVFRYDAHGRRRYLDCSWDLVDGTRVVLEIDGAFHLEVETWSADMVRERGVVIGVGRVLRCSTFEIRDDGDTIMRDLAAIGVPRQR
ncbi:MAG: hypothetical protein WKF72_08365 [Nocardioidaceae bacterium]